MKIQILQGVNLENNCTTIKIELKKQLDPSLIEEIKGYHPIFLKNYKLEKNTLSIQSKLPYLWKEIAKILEEKEARKLALEIIRKQIKSMSTIAVLDIADKMNEEITQNIPKEDISEGFGDSKFNRQYCIGCGKRSAITISFSTTKDSQLAKQIQSDKYLTNRLMDRLSIPSAPWEVIKDEAHLKAIFSGYKKPLVIKPTSLTGGRGVHTKIEKLEDALKAFRQIKNITENKQNKTIIQEQIAGEDYRILVVNGIVEAVTKRIPAFVVGNGLDTIKKLVDETNKDPRRNINNPTHTLKPIIIDKPLVEYLNQQKINLKYVPKKEEKVFVRKVASMSQGGITQDFTDKAHKQIIYICESLAHSLRAYVLGIDVICKDITKPLDKKNGGIIEVNTMPEAYLNMYPVLGPQRHQIGKKFVEGLLGDLKTKKIVILGGTTQQAQKKTQGFKGNTGMYSSNSIYINNELITKKIDTDKAVHALKLNAYLDNIVLHYQTKQEVQKYGFGFDKIDEILKIKA